MATSGFTVFLTGLSGAGKSTIANVLVARLGQMGRAVSLLDGDQVRQHLTSELGFSKEHRDLNVQRVGYVAAEITRCGGVVVCAVIAPYDEARRSVRRMIEAVGGFLLVHVATPLEVCEERDPKGLYAKARAGILTQFTGISDAYECPTDAQLVIDTATTAVGEAVDRILTELCLRGFAEVGAGQILTRASTDLLRTNRDGGKLVVDYGRRQPVSDASDQPL